MPIQTIWAIGESSLSVSGGEQLSGGNQGDGSHLVGLTITLDTANWEQILIDDGDGDFEDNQGNQTLDGSQTFDGVTYGDGIRMEAEYQLVVETPDGTQYTLVSVNFNEPGQNPAYGTVEGLAFVDTGNGFPPVGVPLTVVSAAEGPKSGDTAYSQYFAPPCFVSGTWIETCAGEVPVEHLSPGDLIRTLDRGYQPLRLRAHTHLPAARLGADPKLAPVRIAAGSFGGGLPRRDLRVSPQHRILCAGPEVELMSGQPEGLAAARHLVDGHGVRAGHCADGVTYHHLLFDRHEIVFSEGLASESFRPGPMSEHAIGDDVMAALAAAHPGFDPGGPPARPLLAGFEARTLRAA